jgi:hypothetical protein
METVGLARFNDDDEQSETGSLSGGGDGFLFYTERVEDVPPKAKIHRGNKKANLDPLKDQMRSEKTRLRGEDVQLSDYVYYRDAPEGYARDMSELNLHQVRKSQPPGTWHLRCLPSLVLATQHIATR